MSESTAQVLTENYSTSSDDVRVVFLHLPKTAGSTIHSVLSPHFDKKDTCPERFDGIANMNEGELSQYRYFSGHFSRRSVERIPGQTKVFTFLRSPEERILSLYYFWRSHRAEVVEAGNLIGPRFARELNLEDFFNCKDAAVVNAIDNAYTRQLIDQEKFKHYEHYRKNAPEELVNNVLNYLRRIEFVGFQEHFSDDFKILLSSMGLSMPDTVPSENTRATNSNNARFEKVVEQTVTDSARQSLSRLTAMDQQIYSQAIELFGRG